MAYTDSALAFTEVTLQLRKLDGPSPERDQLIAGLAGADRVDVVRVQNPAGGDEGSTIKRGTLLVLKENAGAYDDTTNEVHYTSDVTCFVPATAADIVRGAAFAIAADNITLTNAQYSMLACYFGGEYNADRVILPEGVTVAAAKDILRAAGIFLRGRVLLEEQDIKFV